MMASKSDSDVTYCSEAENTIRNADQMLRRSQRLSQKSVNYKYCWYSRRNEGMSTLSNTITKREICSRNTLTPAIFSSNDIREDECENILIPQKQTAEIQNYTKTLSNKLRFEPYPNKSSVQSLHSALLTQVIFSPTDLKEDLESNNITLNQITPNLNTASHLKLPSPHDDSSRQEILTTKGFNELSRQEVLTSTDFNEFPHSKTGSPSGDTSNGGTTTSIVFNQHICCTNSRTSKNEILSTLSKVQKTKVSQKRLLKTQPVSNTPADKISLNSDLPDITKNILNLHHMPIIRDPCLRKRKRQKLNDVPLDLSTKKSEEFSCQTSVIPSITTRSGTLHDSIHRPIDPISNVLNTNENNVNSDKKAQNRKNKKRNTNIANRKRKRKIEVFKNIQSSKKLEVLTENPQIKTDFKTSMLPEIYPPHFKYQLPPEAVLTQPLIPTHPPNIMTPDDTQSFELRDSTSTSPSLPESLRGIFGTDDLRHLLDIEKVLTYHLYDYHIQALAIVLNVEEEFLHNTLQKIMKINPSSLRKISNALKSPFARDQDLFITRSTSTEYRSPSSDAVPNSHSPVKSARFLK